MHWSYARVVRRALRAGAIVGVLLAAYVYAVVEPTIGVAIDHEEAAVAARPADGGAARHDDPLFSRGEQVVGGMVAAFATALVVAGVFGTVYAAGRHRLPGRSDLPRALWLAAVGFATVALIPALKYPASPPGVGDPETVGERSVLYLICLSASVLIAIALTRLSGTLRARLADHTRIVAVATASVVAYGLLLVALPVPPGSVEGAAPAEVVWDFRVRSLGGLALLWLGLGLGLGWLLERDTDHTSRATAAGHRSDRRPRRRAIAAGHES